MNLGNRNFILTLAIFLTVVCRLSGAALLDQVLKLESARTPASILSCGKAHAATSQTSRDPNVVNILPTYARLLPFDGTVQFQSPEGRIIEYNIMRKRTFFYTEKGEGPWVLKNYDMLNRLNNEFLPMVSVNPKYVPRDYLQLPLDVENLFETAVSDVYSWSQEQRIQEKKRFFVDDKGEQSIRFLNEHPEFKSTLVQFSRQIFNRIESTKEVTFVELKVAFSKGQQNTFEADINRVLLDLYFTSLQRSYRNQGDPRLSKALKLLDGWVQSHQANQEVKVHLAFDQKIWDILLKQIHSLYVHNNDLKQTDSYQRTRFLRSYVRQFLPLAGMMVSRINGQTLELGRRFNNEETDPLSIFYQDGKSPIRGRALQNTTTQFYKWILEGLPKDSNLWVRAFSATHSKLFAQLGFKEPETPSSFYLQNKQQVEEYWQIEKSWLMQQSLEEWLQKLGSN